MSYAKEKREPHGVMRMRVYNYIKSVSAEQGFPPTVRQIMKGVGLASPDSVQFHIEKLVAEGSIKKVNGKARTITT